MKWTPFVELFAEKQSLPPERKQVLVAMRRRASRDAWLPVIVVGYLRYAGGDPTCPFFVTPSAPDDASVIAWCDCLPEMTTVRGAWEGLT